MLVLVLLLLPTAVLGAGWTTGNRLTSQRGSRFDSLHQLAAGNGNLHALYARIGSGKIDDRVVYQRSNDRGVTWSRERNLFTSSAMHRQVVPNVAIAASGKFVAAVWRVAGEDKVTLFIRSSSDSGQTFGPPRTLAAAKRSAGIGVPAVAIGDDVVAVAWTNRVSGKVSVRSSRNGGRTFRSVETLATTKLSIDCKAKVTDGLVGIAATGGKIHVAWSYSKTRSCLAERIKMRTSANRGKSWKRVRTITRRRSYGWPELAVRGDTVVATVQSPTGGLIVARSGKNGADWRDSIIKPPKGHSLSAADVLLLPRKKAIISYVDETLRKAKLIKSKVVARRSRTDGARYAKPQSVTNNASSLRMAPNIAANGKQVAIVFQSGPLDGSQRNLYATRPQ